MTVPELPPLDALSQKLIETLDPGDPAEYFTLKSILGIAVNSCPNDGGLPASDAELQAFRLAQRCLYDLRRSTRPRLRPNGIIWSGRPSFLDLERLVQLQQEFADLRRTAFPQKWGQFISHGGPAVNALANDPDLIELVESVIGPVSESGLPSCLFYDDEGAHVRPHVDSDNFCVNANFCLLHESTRPPSSHLVVYPVDGDPERVPFTPGTLVLMYADCIVHARTPIGPGEVLHALTIGFRPADELHSPNRQSPIS